MQEKPRLLVIGSPALREQVEHALPDYEVRVTEQALAGLWQGGNEGYDAALVSLAVGATALRAVNGLRRVAPNMRIIVGCAASDEPVAHRAIEGGADDYILEPIRRADVERAFHAIRAKDKTGAAQALPTDDLSVLGDFLIDTDATIHAVLERFARLLRERFDACGASVRIDEHTGTTGIVGDAALRVDLPASARVAGFLALGAAQHGQYALDTADRLAAFGHALAGLYAQVRERCRWQQLAWSDDLSQLHNRRYFERRFDELIQHAVENRQRLTLLLFDIDDFKRYNDRFGHQTGDRLIREVAQLLQHCTRERDLVARVGGDEFAVVLWDAEEPRVPGSEHPREPIELAGRLCKIIGEHDFRLLGHEAPGPLTISGGLACFPWNGTTRRQLVSAADEALLLAKQTGKNLIRIAGRDPESPTSAESQPAAPAEPQPEAPVEPQSETATTAIVAEPSDTDTDTNADASKEKEPTKAKRRRTKSKHKKHDE